MNEYLPLAPGMRVRKMGSMALGVVEKVDPHSAIVRWDYSGLAYKRNRKNFHKNLCRRTGVFVLNPPRAAEPRET